MRGEIQTGRLLDDRFEILKVISRGGMACVYQARDRQSGELVAVKAPHLEFESDAAYYSRFQREEQIGLDLDHPGVLKVRPMTGKKSRPYLVMEHVDGKNLAQCLEESRPFPPAEAVRIGRLICEALEHLHARGVVHRDLKPDNVMLCADGSIRLMDFGIAKSESLRKITFGPLASSMGTPEYIAPEQVRGKRSDARTDIYGAGAILYEMATGHQIYAGDSPLAVMNARLSGDPVAPRQRNPAISPELEEIILHALERNPENRIGSASEMRRQLEDTDHVVVTGRAERLEEPNAWTNQIGWWPKIFVVLAVQVVLFFLLYWHFSQARHSPPTAVIDGGFTPASQKSK